MANFEEAVKITLTWEGGYVNDPNDPGGETKFGISKRNHPGVDIEGLTPEGAKYIYKTEYWPTLYDKITSQLLGSKLFDMGVNMGVGAAVRILQFTLGTTVDGMFGVGTLAAANNAGDAALEPYKTHLARHYQDIVARNPSQQKYIHGWLRRVNS